MSESGGGGGCLALRGCRLSLLGSAIASSLQASLTAPSVITLFQFTGDPGGQLFHLVVLFGWSRSLGRPSNRCLGRWFLGHLLVDQGCQTPAFTPSGRCLQTFLGKGEQSHPRGHIISRDDLLNHIGQPSLDSHSREARYTLHSPYRRAKV